jgi:hypothetical protein
MDFSKIAPTLNELLVQVNAINFNQEEIDFQKNIIKKHTDFKSFGKYLENRHFLFSNLIDLNGFLNGLSSEDDGQTTLTGDIKILINTNLNSTVIEGSNKWNRQLSKLTQNNRNLFDDFEIKLLNLFYRLVIENSKKDPSSSETLQALLKDYEIQKESIELNDEQQVINPLDYLQAVSLPNLNKRIQNLDSKNFYFPKKSQYLKKLHNALVEHNLIEANDDFEKLFEKEFNLKNKLKPIVWTFKGPMTTLFYLLYRLNDGNNVHKNYSLSKIAYDLFKLKDNTTENSLNVSLNQVFCRFNEAQYVNRNMKLITKILNSIEL